MGEYFAVVCDERKEKLHPPAYFNNKFPGICNSTNIFGQLLAFVMCTRWKGKEVTIIDDTSHFFYLCDYENITAYMFEEYKKIYDTKDISHEYSGSKGLKCEEDQTKLSFSQDFIDRLERCEIAVENIGYIFRRLDKLEGK
jgi:hypothetical protein